jgi:hypothetical protein
VYTGEFKDGKYDGVGECVWADGRWYRGEWSLGHAEGYGVEMRPDGSIRHDGEWLQDKPVRNGKEVKEPCPKSKKNKLALAPESARPLRELAIRSQRVASTSQQDKTAYLLDP